MNLDNFTEKERKLLDAITGIKIIVTLEARSGVEEDIVRSMVDKAVEASEGLIGFKKYQPNKKSSLPKKAEMLSFLTDWVEKATDTLKEKKARFTVIEGGLSSSSSFGEIKQVKTLADEETLQDFADSLMSSVEEYKEFVKGRSDFSLTDFRQEISLVREHLGTMYEELPVDMLRKFRRVYELTYPTVPGSENDRELLVEFCEAIVFYMKTGLVSCEEGEWYMPLADNPTIRQEAVATLYNEVREWFPLWISEQRGDVVGFESFQQMVEKVLRVKDIFTEIGKDNDTVNSVYAQISSYGELEIGKRECSRFYQEFIPTLIHLVLEDMEQRNLSGLGFEYNLEFLEKLTETENPFGAGLLDLNSLTESRVKLDWEDPQQTDSRIWITRNNPSDVKTAWKAEERLSANELENIRYFLSLEDVSFVSSKEAFDALLKYEGISGYTERIIEWYEKCFGKGDGRK